MNTDFLQFSRYNSVIFSSTGNNEYKVAVVKSEFLDGAPFDMRLVNNFGKSDVTPSPSGQILANDSIDVTPDKYYIPTVVPEDTNLLEALQTKSRAGRLTRMSNAECVKAYMANPQTQYGNVIAVSERAVSDSPVM